MILLTTSRRPSGVIRTLCRDLANCIPHVVRVNRGKMSLDGIVERTIGLNASRVIIIDRWHGGPGKINLFQITSTGLKPFPPIMLINVVHLRREFKEEPLRIRTSVITMDSEVSSQLKRIASHLSRFFGLPVLSRDEVAGKYDTSMHLRFGSSQHPQITFLLLQRMVEIGPRITLSKLVWEVS